MFTKFHDFLNESSNLNEMAYTPKDAARINGIMAKAKGDEAKAVQLATNMANAIGDEQKLAMRRAASAEILGEDHPVTKAFGDKMTDTGIKVDGPKGNTLGKLGSEIPVNKDRYLSDYRKPNPVLPLGSVNLITGNSKIFNVFDTWGRGDRTTIELWVDNNPDPDAGPRYRLLFTSGSDPIYEIGIKSPFMHDQTHRPLFYAEMIDWANIGDADLLVKKYGIKSALGYTYK